MKKTHLEIKELIFHCIERLLMTKTHLDEVNNYILRRTSEDHQTESFYDCLKIFLKGVVHYASICKMPRDAKHREIAFKKLYGLFESIRKFQDQFNILPKEDAPKELHRFLRNFSEQIPQKRDGTAKKEKSKIEYVLYLWEQNSSTIFEITPLKAFEKNLLSQFYKDEIEDDVVPETAKKETPYFHMLIPRIESKAPLYWPTLAHEFAHQIMELDFFEKTSKSIVDDWIKFFKKSITDSGPFKTSFKKLTNVINPSDETRLLESWLTECWCDCYAYFAIGPAFIFSQRNTFFFIQKLNDSDLLGSKEHPPNFIRLQLLFLLAKKHQVDLMKKCPSLNRLLTYYPTIKLLPDDELLKKAVLNVGKHFWEFFKYEFAIDGTRQTEKLASHIAELKKESLVFDETHFKIVIERLNQNYPVPSIVNKENLTEKPITVQELMLAAWMSYEERVKFKIINYFYENIEELNTKNKKDLWKTFEYKIVPTFERFNESVMRSLQISEWVKLFQNTPSFHDGESGLESNIKNKRYKDYNLCDSSLLVDYEIKKMIKDGELNVIPLIDVEKQINACSLDIRLGPSFQTYQPNQSGVVDLNNDESVMNVFKNSTDVDLDFLEPIVIAPGQFVLGHSMEYIVLPENVAAQVEGRSSFARLGVQLHMTANLIDPGFRGSITFEIYNAGPNPIKLYPGYRIGQLRFFSVKHPENPYNIKKDAKFKGMLIHANTLLKKKDIEVEKIYEAIVNKNNGNSKIYN